MATERATGQSSQAKAAASEDEVLNRAMQFFERLNDRARSTPALPELEESAEAALRSFRKTVQRLEVLKPE